MRTILQYILNFIFPLTCAVCGKNLKADDKRRICDECWNNVKYTGIPIFPKPYWLESIYACCSYEGAVKKCIHLLKYNGKTYIAHLLATLLVDCADTNFTIEDIDFFVPVPLHKKRHRQRGFNQAELLLKEMNRKFNKKVVTDNLVKIKNTKSQVFLSGKERESNILDTFHLKNPEIFPDKNILLIDDVSTTGSTLNECAKTLRKAGAKKIHGLVLAHGK